MAVFCLAGGLLVRRTSDFSGYEFLPVALDSVLETDYGLDPNPPRRPPLRLDIIWDTILDHDPNADLENRKEVLLSKLQTPVPVVTPQLCQGRHIIYATQDTWLDSARPTNIKGADTTLRLGFSDTGKKRVLLYFPVSDRIPAGTFIGRAFLELDLPPDTPRAVPGGVCFFNLRSIFDETSTNWSNQPAAFSPYCSPAIPGTDHLHTWDVTGLVYDWLQGRYPNSGLMMDLASPAAVEPVYVSREAASLANSQTGDQSRPPGPRLIIDCGGLLPTPAPVEVAQAHPTTTSELPAATDAAQTPSIAATGTPPASTPVPTAGSPPPVSATPPSTPVIPSTGTSIAATATAPPPTSTRPVSSVSPTLPPIAPTVTVPSPTAPPASTATSPPPATSTSPPPATSTSPPPEPTRSRATSTPTPTSTPSPTATATASPTPTATPVPLADLAVSKSASAEPVLAGHNLVYTLNIVNNGPAAATGVTVIDNLPAVSLVSAVSSQGGCSGTAALTCNLGDINPGGAASITVVVNVPASATGSLANSATVSASQADPNPANNTATAVTTISRAAELAITKSDSPDPVAAGQTLTYTLSAINNGPSTATGVVITDTLPAGITFISVSSGCSETGGAVTCTMGSLASGGSMQYRVVVAVPAALTGTLTNQAGINGNETDPNPANNTAVVTTTIRPAADLSITKNANPGSVNAGQVINYMISVTNNGPANATGVIITDILPAGLTVITAPGCVINGNILTCPAGNVDSGKNASQAIIVRVDPAVPPGTVTNLAPVGGNEFDPAPANNTATAGTSITTSANLGVTVSAEPEVALPGGDLTYTIVVSNSGPSDAAGAIITDTLPAEVSLTALPPGCQESGPQIVCNAGSLTSGGSAHHQLIVTVPATATGVLTNQVIIHANPPDPDPANNLASLVTMIAAPTDADLALSKSASAASPLEGALITYAITVTNRGPAAASGIVIRDVLPAGVIYASDDGGGAYTAGTGLWAVGALSSGANAVVHISATVDPGTSGTAIVNIATIDAAGQPDPIASNNNASATITPVLPVLTITDAVVQEGDSGSSSAVFTLTLSTPSPQLIEIDYTTADNTATVTGGDYVAASGTITFTPGSTVRTIAVLVNGDTTEEAGETFFVNLSNPTNVTIADSQGLGTIQNDDSPVAVLGAVQDAWIDESNPGGKHGEEIELFVKPQAAGNDERRIVIEFDLSSIPGSDTVLTASLDLSELDAVTGQTISVYRLTSPWEEAFVSWNKGTQTISWVTPGGDYDPAAWASFSPASAGLRQVDVTTLVQGWLDGTYPNYGMLLMANGSDGNVRFYSREAPAAGDRPTLQVQHTALWPFSVGAVPDRGQKQYLPLIVK